MVLHYLNYSMHLNRDADIQIQEMYTYIHRQISKNHEENKYRLFIYCNKTVI